MAPGLDRETLLKKARQTETAAYIDESAAISGTFVPRVGIQGAKGFLMVAK